MIIPAFADVAPKAKAALATAAEISNRSQK
jgi:hypothetical protein